MFESGVGTLIECHWYRYRSKCRTASPSLITIEAWLQIKWRYMELTISDMAHGLKRKLTRSNVRLEGTILAMTRSL